MARRTFVPFPEVVDRTTVGKDDVFISPTVPKDVDEQFVAAAAGLALIAVVGAHDFLYVSFFHHSLESRQVGLP